MASGNYFFNDTVAVTTSESNATNGTYDASCHGTFDTDPGVMLSLKIYFGASLIFVLTGLVGNTLSILVFSSKEMRSVSSNVYLLALAASDSSYLISVFLFKSLTTFRCWYLPEISMDIANRSSIICVLLQYLSDLFSDFSTCLILAFTIERSLAVFLPIRFKELCTVHRAHMSCLGIFVVLSALIAPHHILFIGVLPDYQICTIVRDENIFLFAYVVEFSLFRVIPVIIIAVLNALIIGRIGRLTREKNKRRAQSRQLLEAVTKKQKHKKGEDRNLQLTIILILVSTSYILAYIPVLVTFGIKKLVLSELIHVSNEIFRIIDNCSKALYISGFAINFFLYTMSGRVFRDQLKKIVCPGLVDHKPFTQTTVAPREASSVV